MPSGTVHGVSAFVFAIAFMLGAVGGHLAGLTLTAVALVSMIIGELLLSPDLDHDSGAQAYRRWGWPLKYIWRPYQKLVPHRGVLSHCPVIGTFARLGYLVAWVFVARLVYLVGLWSEPSIYDVVHWIPRPFLYEWRWHLVAVVVGVEMSTDLHLLLDHWLEGD